MSNEDTQPKPVSSIPWMRRFIIYAGVLLVVFLLGFVPMWLKARTASSSLVEAEHQLSLVRMQNLLASAVIDARRADYEPARQAASQFFTSLRAEIDKGDASNFTKSQRESMQASFAGRDEIITLLARSDPASADRLSDVYVAYRKIMSG
jgi:biopolymer transport protein ExbB/TolQ